MCRKIFFYLLIFIITSIISFIIVDTFITNGQFTQWQKVTTLPIPAQKIGILSGDKIYFQSTEGEFYSWNNLYCEKDCLNKEGIDSKSIITSARRESCFKSSERIGHVPGIIVDCAYWEPIPEQVGINLYILLDDNTVWNWNNSIWDPGGLSTIVQKILLYCLFEPILILIIVASYFILKATLPNQAQEPT